MSDDHVYLSLAEEHGEADARWAFGTGFEDPLHGVDTTVPAGLDPAALAAVCLALADDALVSAQRLAEWVTLAPELEEEMALANIGLDLLGQARLLYARTGQAEAAAEGEGAEPRGEDAYAYFRDPAGFRSVELAELPGGDFAFTVVRLLVMATLRLAAFERLRGAADPVLAAVAAKGVKELEYHRQYAAEWMVRLGDGTEESRARTLTALEQVLPYADAVAEALAGSGFGSLALFGVTAGELRAVLGAVLQQVATEAELELPQVAAREDRGREGQHTPHLTSLLDELQVVARAHPGAVW